MYIKGLNDNDKVEGENPPIPCLEQCNKKQESKQTDCTQEMSEIWISHVKCLILNVGHSFRHI